jgi:tRNA modification GTPase
MPSASHAGMVQASANLLTAPGTGGIAVILLHGAGWPAILSKIFRPKSTHTNAEPGRLQLGQLIDPDDGSIMDEAIVHRRSDHAEINIHGGPMVVRNVLDAIGRLGATIEQPGSANNAAGLPAEHPQWGNPAIGIEMLGILPRCQSLLAAEAISRQWSGGISQLANRAKQGGTLQASQSLASELAQAAEGFELLRRLTEPCEVVLAGAPNAGKSTLANMLLGRQASIVHQMPGTTRDYVRELAIVGGVPIWLTDTAGLWQGPADCDDHLQRAVDSESVSRARRRIEQAGLVILLTHGAEQIDIATQAKRILRVWSKCDIARPGAQAGKDFDLVISAQTGEGILELKQAICRELGLGDLDLSLPRAFTHRQAELLAQAGLSLADGDAKSAGALLDQLLKG